jgi:phosphoribosyl 1,2-cyclic phosphodiesterase
MPAKHGWGHSTLEDVLTLGRKAGTPHLVLFHHDPERDDDAIDGLAARATEWLAVHSPHTRATAAREGMELEIGPA